MDEDKDGGVHLGTLLNRADRLQYRSLATFEADLQALQAYWQAHSSKEEDEEHSTAQAVELVVALCHQELARVWDQLSRLSALLLQDGQATTAVALPQHQPEPPSSSLLAAKAPVVPADAPKQHQQQQPLAQQQPQSRSIPRVKHVSWAREPQAH